MFDENKKSLILFKSGYYYEPIYYVLVDSKDQLINTPFFNKNIQFTPINNLLKIANKTTNGMCAPLPSMPKVYNFVSNKPASEIFDLLENINDADIEKQIINYSGQTIAFIVNLNNSRIYIPTQSSSPIEYNNINSKNTIPKLLLDNYDKYLDYNNTISLLNDVKQLSNNKILCKPKLRVEEEGLTVGILTETNQMIMLDKPELVTKTELPSINEKMTISNEFTSETGDSFDEERVLYVNKIHLETEFYNIFRNTIRILLSKYEKRNFRIKIEETINSPFITYTQKLEEVINILRNLAEDYITWDDEFDLKEFIEQYGENNSLKQSKNKLSSCVLFKENKCGKMPMCGFNEEKNICTTTLPSINILTGDNSNFKYYAKMADELVRYNRIKSFIFKPQSFMSFGKINYDLEDNEVLFLENTLTSDYFDNLIEKKTNKYIKNNTFQTTQPVKSVPYDSEYKAKPAVENKKINAEEKRKTDSNSDSNIQDKIKDVDTEITRLVHNNLWKSFFPLNVNELKFNIQTPEQTFEPLKLILLKYKKQLGILTVNEIKEILVEEYEKRLTNTEQLKELWKKDGKNKFAKSLSDQISVADIIMSEGYYATPVDYILIANKYKLPLILYTSFNIPLNNNEILKTMESDKYIFLKIPGLKLIDNKMLKYNIIVEKNNLHINLSDFTQENANRIINAPIFNLEEVNKVIILKKVVKQKPDVKPVVQKIKKLKIKN